ncbi:MAG: AAA family ATPase [Nanoarchaeota archaeon]
MWYKKYNWKNNPFSIRVNPSIFVGLGDIRKRLASYVEGGNIVLIVGGRGVGKTSLLKWLETRLKKHSCFYMNAEAIKDGFSIIDFLIANRPFLRSYPKRAVLLIDESQRIGEWFRIEAQRLWEAEVIKSLVLVHDGLAVDGSDIKDFSANLKSRVGDRIIYLKKLNKEDAYDLIRIRCGRYIPFDGLAMDEIIKRSDGNPRKILGNCERVCIESDKEKISKYEVEKILKIDHVSPDVIKKIR